MTKSNRFQEVRKGRPHCWLRLFLEWTFCKKVAKFCAILFLATSLIDGRKMPGSCPLLLIRELADEVLILLVLLM